MVRDQIMGFRKTPVMKKQSRDTGDGPRLEIALKQYMGRSVGPPLAGRTVVVQCLHVGSFQWWTRGLLLCTFISFALTAQCTQSPWNPWMWCLKVPKLGSIVPSGGLFMWTSVLTTVYP